TESLGTTVVGQIQAGDNSTGRTYDVALDQAMLGNVYIPAPFIDDLSAAASVNSPRVITLRGYNLDAVCPLTFAIVAPPQHGSLGSIGNVQCSQGIATAQVTYTPNT